MILLLKISITRDEREGTKKEGSGAKEANFLMTHTSSCVFVQTARLYVCKKEAEETQT